MSGYLWLVIVGLSLIALPWVVYPLVLLLVRPDRVISLPKKEQDWVILATGEIADYHRRKGFPVVEFLSEAEGRLTVLPAGGHLTLGGIRRLLAPLVDENVGLVVGRLLSPEVEELGREGGAEVAVLHARQMTQNWRWYLGCREASHGVPASVDGFPVALRAEVCQSTRAETLTLLSKNKKGRGRVVFLHGRRGLVGRQPVEDSLDPLVDELTAAYSAGRQALARRWKSLSVLLRYGIASLTPLWLFMVLLGAGLGLLDSGAFFYKLILVLTGIFLLGALIGGLTLKYGYRSKVYFPLFWLAAGIAAIIRSYSHSNKNEDTL